MTNNQNAALLDRLRDAVVLPIAARVPMTDATSAAWWAAPLVVITCRPPVRADLYGFADGAVVPCGGLDNLPDEATDAVAAFLSDGLRQLGADAHDEVVAAVDAEQADIVVRIRADKGEAVAHLVGRSGDKHTVLFALAAVADEAAN